MSAKRCEICEKRPAMTAAAMMAKFGTVFPYCDPCMTFAEMENVHSDDGHGTDAEGSNDTDGCWICHPELDRSAEDYAERAGTSRAGMRMTVRRSLSGREKADMIATRITRKYPIDAAKVSTRKGTVTLKVELKETGLVLRWDLTGRYLYAVSSAVVDGKSRKVRNASEALKLLGL